ncbi:MAG: hypothetical protein AABO58_20200 [Acidobacteriota bacterium]
MKRACIVLLVAAALVSCVSAPKAGAADVPTEADVIDTLWRYHTRVVRSAFASEFSLNGDDFARSIEFLEKVTGIYSDTPNWAGRIPTEELPNTFRRWEAWYEKHRGELGLSQDGCGVVIKPPNKR